MDISKPIRTWSLTSIVLFFAFVQAASASSDSKVDCSSVAKWNSDASYKRGDLVVHKAGVTEYDAEYKCIKDQCKGAGNNQPYYGDGSTWDQVGVCK
jgi:hypothetical protein